VGCFTFTPGSPQRLSRGRSVCRLRHSASSLAPHYGEKWLVSHRAFDTPAIYINLLVRRVGGGNIGSEHTIRSGAGVDGVIRDEVESELIRRQRSNLPSELAPRSSLDTVLREDAIDVDDSGFCSILEPLLKAISKVPRGRSEEVVHQSTSRLLRGLRPWKHRRVQLAECPSGAVAVQLRYY
jgi:hypothetical protein